MARTRPAAGRVASSGGLGISSDVKSSVRGGLRPGRAIDDKFYGFPLSRE
ncbi:MAG: hypothetical protein NTY34_02330 [Candidatus Omnitrophica bacterium]|nr:hypothetical protein [Candidatus Omnitrophota bacterium]